MLKKKNRLTKKEFDFIFKKGGKKFSKNFMFLKMENKDFLKISTSVSKKIYKTAVDRNKARRKIYNLIQNDFEKISQNLWGVLIMTKPVLDINDEVLKKEILWLLN